MKSRLTAVAQIIAIGALVMIGIRAAEWVIPGPATRVVICFANELDQVEICLDVKEIIERAEAKKSLLKVGS